MYRIGGKYYIKIKKDPKRTGNSGMKCSDLEESGDFSSIFSTVSPLGGFGKLGKVYLKTKFQVEQVLRIQTFRFG